MSLCYSESAVTEHHAPLETMISFWVQRVLPVHHVLQWLSLRSDSKPIAASSYEVHFGRAETSIIHLGTGFRKTFLELARNGKHHLLHSSGWFHWVAPTDETRPQVVTELPPGREPHFFQPDFFWEGMMACWFQVANLVSCGYKNRWGNIGLHLGYIGLDLGIL